MHSLFPNERIEVTPSRSAIVLSGHVTTEDVAKHAGALASAYSKNVVNVLTFGPVGAEEVLLEVRFAEVDRTALIQTRQTCSPRPGQYHRPASPPGSSAASANHWPHHITRNGADHHNHHRHAPTTTSATS